MSDTPIEQDMALTEAVMSFIDTVERAAYHFRNKDKGGQSVGFFSDFANITPSTLRELEWWVQRFNQVTTDKGATYCLKMVKYVERHSGEGYMLHQVFEILRGMRQELGDETIRKLIKAMGAIPSQAEMPK